MPQRSYKSAPDTRGYYGNFGGRFVPDTLMQPLIELEQAYFSIRDNPDFQTEFKKILKDFVGRPTALYYAGQLTRELGGAKIYLKREDIAHTGAHKINNAVGQILLARQMGKTRIIAETGAGQHGVATAASAAMMGLSCIIYMGSEDMKRQEPNVFRMRLLGAEVRAVESGSKTLKDAVSEAMRDWVSNIADTHYIIGSALGPHPYPLMVRDFQRIIGEEARMQMLEHEGRLPDEIIACLGGGSNAIGAFYAFLDDPDVTLTAIEAGGRGIAPGQHAARFSGGKVGIFQGMKTFILQDPQGQIEPTHSISAGLDYAGVGPEHAWLMQQGRVSYRSVGDDDALRGFSMLSQKEGIIPALESSHAIAYALKCALRRKKDDIILVNLSGRGDKDLNIVTETLLNHV